MNAISFTVARERLAATLDAVCNDHAPVIVTRGRKEAVVVMSLKDYESLEETAFLLKSPRNAERLLNAIASFDAGQGIERSLKQKTEDSATL